MNRAQTQRVTLDHPALGGRVRRYKDETISPHRRVVVGSADSMLVRRARQARRQPNVQKTATATSSRKVSASLTKEIRAPTADRNVDGVRPKNKRNHQYRKFEHIDNSSLQPVGTKRKNKAQKHNRFGVKVIYAMALLLFVVGMAVAVKGYRSNQKVEEQVAVLGETIEDVKSGAPNSIADTLPNEDKVEDHDIAQYKVAPDKPRYFRAPSIGVGTTRVLETGLTPDGAVDTPKGIYDTSWYNGSASITDDTGAMFVVGHYVGPHEAGVFWNLKKLNRGDVIEIEQGDGTISKFRVVEKIDYPVDNVDMRKALLPVNPDKLGLNLMTCGGSWDVSSQLYDQRTLVRTEKI